MSAYRTINLTDVLTITRHSGKGPNTDTGQQSMFTVITSAMVIEIDVAQGILQL